MKHMARFKERMNITAISRLAANASWSGFSAGEDKQVAIYNPLPGWVVLETQTIVHSSNNGSRAVSTIAGGLNLVTEDLVDRVYKEVISAAGRYKDKTISGKLQTELMDRKNEVRKWSSNKNTITAEVSCKAHGSALDRKRGWEEISVIATLVYIGESSRLALVSELEQAYRIDVDSMTPSMLTQHGIKLSDEQLALPERTDLELAERSTGDVKHDVQSNEPSASPV